jgi:phosphoribosylcarboxyaminoimidazole (NCAIR) mutase
MLINTLMMNIFINNAFKIYKNNIVKNNNNIKTIGLICGGLSDIKYVAEAFFILTCLDIKINIKMDIGINEIVLHDEKLIFELNNNMINIVFAGMENALTDVIATVTNKPLLSVPTNVSYGYGANGNVSLKSLLNSPIKGIGIFNITNTYGACIAANKLLLLNEFDYCHISNSLDLSDILSKEYIIKENIVVLEENHNGTKAGLISAHNQSKVIFVYNNKNDKNVIKSLLNICVSGIIYINNLESFIEFITKIKNNYSHN